MIRFVLTITIMLLVLNYSTAQAPQGLWEITATDTGGNYTSACPGNSIIGSIRSDRTGLRPVFVHLIHSVMSPFRAG